MKSILRIFSRVSLRWGATAAALLASSAGVQGAFIIQDLGASAVLQPETADQTIDLYINNTGAAANVGGFDLKLLINGGSGPAPQLSITGPNNANLRIGSVFTAANSLQSGDALNTAYSAFFSVSINDPFSPPSMPSGANLVARLTFSTVGATPGPWSLSFSGSDLSDSLGDSLSLQFSPESLSLAPVPEPAETVAVSALLLGGFCLVRRWRKAGASVSAN